MSLQAERRDGVMNKRLEDLTMALSDAGCGSDAIETAKRLWAAGRTEDLIRHLRGILCVFPRLFVKYAGKDASKTCASYLCGVA